MIEELFLVFMTAIVVGTASFVGWLLRTLMVRLESKIDLNAKAISMVEKRQALLVLSITDSDPKVAAMWERRRKMLEGNPEDLEDLTLNHLEKVIQGRF